MWRVQATSGTTRGRQDWSPFLVRTRLDAWRAARDVRRTLAHLPDVRVRVRRATAADLVEVRRIEAEEVAALATTVVHRAHAPGDDRTVCGLPRTGLTAVVLAVELWSDSPRHCPGCRPAAAPARTGTT